MGSVSKSFALILVGIVAISFVCLVGSISMAIGQSGTNVSGIISSNTTWTQAGSPYNLTADVIVNIDITLTIQAGTTVNVNNNNLWVNGTLQALGTDTNQIVFNNGEIDFLQSSTSWNQQTSAGCIITNSILVDCIVHVISSSPLIQDNKITGQAIEIDSGSPQITNNNINIPPQLNYLHESVDLVSAIGVAGDNNAFISNNIITGEFQKGAISLQGSPTIVGNLISCNSGLFFNLGSSGSIMNNTFSTSTLIASDVTTTQPINDIIIYNNFENLSNNGIVWGATSNLNVTYNWWGTTDSEAISKLIPNLNGGAVTFMPFLTEPNPHAPSLSLLQTATPTPTASPTPTITPIPTVPELSWLVVVPLLLFVFFVAVVFRYRQQVKKS